MREEKTLLLDQNNLIISVHHILGYLTTISTACIASNDEIIREKQMGNDMEIFGAYFESSSRLDRLKKTTQNFSRDSSSPEEI
jgi:hypothetical protein